MHSDEMPEHFVRTGERWLGAGNSCQICARDHRAIEQPYD